MFTREGDRYYIDGVEVPKAQWEALYVQTQEDADDEEEEALEWPDKALTKGQP